MVNTKPNWPTPNKFPDLQKGHIHVWFTQIDHLIDQMPQFLQLLSIDEKKRAEAFHFAKDKQRFIVARGLLRSILGNYAKIAPAQLEFECNPHGKPALKNFPQLQFNLSHTENVVMCAYSIDHELGIDIEYMERNCDMEGIAKRFFSTQEYQSLKNLTGQQQRKAFFNGWTRKEAFLKATGQGLTFSLSKIEVSLLSEETAAILAIHDEQIKSQPWSLYALNPDPNYAAALVTKGQPQQIDTWRWNKELSF